MPIRFVAAEYEALNEVPTVALLLVFPNGSNEKVWFHAVPQFAEVCRARSSYAKVQVWALAASKDR